MSGTEQTPPTARRDSKGLVEIEIGGQLFVIADDDAERFVQDISEVLDA